MNSRVDIKIARGVLDHDGEYSELHIQAAPDQVIETLCTLRQGGDAQLDVTRGGVKPTDTGCFVVRHSGHSWSQVVDPRDQAHLNRYMDEAQGISRLLKTRAIALSYSDTAGAWGYSLYDAGELLEQLSFVEGEVESFTSITREVSHGDIVTQRLDFFEALLKDLDLLAGYLTFGIVVSVLPDRDPGVGGATSQGQVFEFDAAHYLKLDPGQQPQRSNPFEVRPDRKGCLGAVFLPFLT